MHLLQHRRGALFFDKGRVRDLRVAHPLRRIAAGHPQELVLKERVVPVIRVIPVLQDLRHRLADIRVRNHCDLLRVERHRILSLLSLGKNISVQIHLLQIREHGLPVLQDRERPSDPRDVVGRIPRIIQDQVGKIQKRIVIDSSREIFALQAAVLVFFHGLLPAGRQLLPLLLRAAQAQLPDVIERIPDLVADSQRDQQVRMQICVHMCVQICAELVLTPDISLHDRPHFIQPVFLGLAHQRLGNGRNMRLHLDPPVRVNIGDLRVPQPEYIDQLVISIYIAGHRPPDHQKAVLSFRERKAAQCGQVADQIPCAVIRCGENEVHGAGLSCGGGALRRQGAGLSYGGWALRRRGAGLSCSGSGRSAALNI